MRWCRKAANQGWSSDKDRAMDLEKRAGSASAEPFMMPLQKFRALQEPRFHRLGRIFDSAFRSRGGRFGIGA